MLYDQGNITRNKARLIVQVYNQEKNIDYDETFTPVAKIETIRMLIAIASYMGFKLYQMDMKSAFLNGYLKEEVFDCQPPRFESHEFPDHVYKLDKVLYGLKQAPRAWYKRLSKFLLENGFSRGKIDNTLFLSKSGKSLLIFKYILMTSFLGPQMNRCAMSFLISWTVNLRGVQWGTKFLPCTTI